MQEQSIAGRISTFKKFKDVDDPHFKNFILNIPEKFSDLVQRFDGSILASEMGVSDQILENRNKLGYFITKFHNESGTLTTAVKTAIDRLQDRNAIILSSAHQPNLFPYGGIFKKMLLLQTLKETLEEHSEKTG